MIPRHLSLVPVNPFQHAALQAIIDVEDRQQRRGRYPYAQALFRQLRGGKAGCISASDVKRAAANYCPTDRCGEPKERYIAALNVLIESRGQVCTLPLSGCAVGQYFPDSEHRLRDRRYKQWDFKANRRDRNVDKARTQKRRRYQAAVAQAEIDLAFITPSQLPVWYARLKNSGIFDDDLNDMVQAWGRRFVGLKDAPLRSGQPMWAILFEMRDELAERTEHERWFDGLQLPNKLTFGAGLRE